MKTEKKAEWSCKNCDAISSGEPKWWPTIERTSKFETSAGVCKPCFRLLTEQLKFDNKAVKQAKTTKKKATKKAAKK